MCCGSVVQVERHTHDREPTREGEGGVEIEEDGADDSSGEHGARADEDLHQTAMRWGKYTLR